MDDHGHDIVYCPGSLFKFGHRTYSLPRGKGQTPKPLSDFGFREGLELRTVCYFTVALAIVAALRHIPLVDMIAGIPPGWFAYVIVPGVVAWRLTVAEPAGRPVRNWLLSLILHKVTPGQHSAGRALSPEGVRHADPGLTAIAASHDDPRLRKCVLRGPAEVRFSEVAYYDERGNGRGRITRPSLPGGYGKGRRVEPGETLRLTDGARVAVHP